MKRLAASTMMVLLSLATTLVADDDEGWVTLFDGKSMNNWKASENTDSWKFVDGELVCHGNRSHLFYVGEEEPWVNFHLKVEVMTLPNSNSGIYFHTKFQESGWPKLGFEAQVNNTARDPKRTASLYNRVNVMEAPAVDNEWFTEEVIVDGDTITIKVDGKTIIKYVEPEDVEPQWDCTRVLDKGTFALQAHDPGSKVRYRSIKVKRLP